MFCGTWQKTISNVVLHDRVLNWVCGWCLIAATFGSIHSLSQKREKIILGGKKTQIYFNKTVYPFFVVVSLITCSVSPIKSSQSRIVPVFKKLYKPRISFTEKKTKINSSMHTYCHLYLLFLYILVERDEWHFPIWTDFSCSVSNSELLPSLSTHSCLLSWNQTTTTLKYTLTFRIWMVDKDLGNGHFSIQFCQRANSSLYSFWLSLLLAPLFNIWVSDFCKRKPLPQVGPLHQY